MEFWILALFIGVFSLWVQSRLRRRNEDERFANVIEALNPPLSLVVRFNPGA